jgi:hypothetical protein
MKKNDPYWYKLIAAFKAAEPPYKITTGLTIPFLMGSYVELDEPFEDINHLVQAIINSQIDKFPIIQRCHVIGKHVIMVEEKAYCNKTYEKFPRIESEISKGLLLISTNSPNLGKTFEKICYNLRAEYLGPILRKEYSWSNGKNSWLKFDQREIDIINSVK